jgi:uncharacterized protein (DUF4415 family)
MSTHDEKRAIARARAREYLARMTDEEDQEITRAAQSDPDALPLSDAELARMRPVSEAEAAALARRQRGRPRLETTKRLVSLRLDPEVVERFRATGPGWQSRVNEVLKAHLPGG